MIYNNHSIITKFLSATSNPFRSMRSFRKAQVDYAVYDARREKDLMEARLRGELDDAQHQQEIQQVSSLWRAYGWRKLAVVFLHFCL